MFFHSPTALLIFLPIIFILYPLLERESLKVSKFFLLIFSLMFYGFNHPWFIIPLLISASSDFIISKKLLYISNSNIFRNFLIALSLFINIGLLITFKYIPFIEETLSSLKLSYLLGAPTRFEFILPAGISFYTFQTLSYVFDIYKGKINTSPRFIDYLLYVCYFPQLVAGPILRPSDFFDNKSKLKINSSKSNYIYGFKRICFGLFLKLCLADTLARYNDIAFAGDYLSISTADAWTMAFGFGLQIYFDFSAYSHMAIGISEILGLSIRENFCFPYLSTSPSMFWRRWHISLSSWVNDYLYNLLNFKLPLWFAGALPLLVTWAIMGLWHGSSWRFVVWGLLNGIFVLIHRFYKKYLINFSLMKIFSNQFLSNLITLFSIMSSWIFFRATSWDQAIYIFAKLWHGNFALGFRENYYLFVFIFTCFTFFSGFIWQLRDRYVLNLLLKNKICSWIACEFCIFFSILFIESQVPFIYFQF